MRETTERNLVLCEIGTTGIDGLETYSPYCLKVHRALRAAGLTYTSRHGRMPADFKDVNPAGQVPVLLVDGEPVADSTRILARIGELAPGALEAKDARTNAEAWLWEEWADRALGPFVVAARWADDRNWPAVHEAFFGKGPWFVRKLIAPSIRARVLKGLSRDTLRAGADALWTDFRRILDHLETRAPHRGFWLGDTLTVADVGLFGHLRALRTDLTRWQAREMELRPALVDYLDRVDARTRAARDAVVPLRRAS